MPLAREVHPYDTLGTWGIVHERTYHAGRITFRTAKGTVNLGALDTVVASLRYQFQPPRENTFNPKTVAEALCGVRA
jgi:hypothetical protein